MHAHRRRPTSGSATTCAERRSEEHTSELQSRLHLVCRLLLEKKKFQLHSCISISPATYLVAKAQRRQCTKLLSPDVEYDADHYGQVDRYADRQSDNGGTQHSS